MEIDAALLALRLATGLVLAAHGAQKTLGAFGGSGPTQWRRHVADLGFKPASLWAWLAALAQLVGGLALAAGLATPVASAALAVTMIVALRTRLGAGFWERADGIEYPLLLLVVLVALGIAGAGRWSIDSFAKLEIGGAATFSVLAIVGIVSVSSGMLRGIPRASR